MKFVVLAFVLSCSVASHNSVAKLQPYADYSVFASPPQESANKNKISASQAASMVKKRYGGKVLNVTTLQDKSGYKVKLLKDNGHIISVFVNAKNGKMKR